MPQKNFTALNIHDSNVQQNYENTIDLDYIVNSEEPLTKNDRNLRNKCSKTNVLSILETKNGVQQQVTKNSSRYPVNF